MKIALNLATHCIETEIRRLFQKAMADYFRADQTRRKALEPRLALLEESFKTFDFGVLRSRCPELAGGTRAAVFLQQHQEGRPLVRIVPL